MANLEELRKRRDELLRKERGRQSLQRLSQKRKLEERQLKAEIRALENPGSITARRGLKNAAVGLGRFIKKRADIISENLAEEQRKEKMRMAKTRSLKKRKRR